MMAVLVWNMKYMTRYLGFIARPIVKIVADNEIIACGLKSEQGQNNIIYTPYPNRDNYNFLVYPVRKELSNGVKEKTWQKTLAITTNNFSGELVQQVSLPDVKNGNIVRGKEKKKKRRREEKRRKGKKKKKERGGGSGIEKTEKG